LHGTGAARPADVEAARVSRFSQPSFKVALRAAAFSTDCCGAQSIDGRRIVELMAHLARQAGNLTQENSHMSMQAHLAELEKRHRALEAELAEALAHPSTDDLKIAELKRRKLLVKDQIARLHNETVASIH
jgi:hypothetical protein